MDDNNDIDDLITRAQAAYREDAIDRAIALFSNAVERAPENLEVCLGLGESLVRAGHFEDATDYLERADQARPNDAHLLDLLGYTYGQTGRFQSAETCFRKLVRMRGGDAQTLCNLGSVLNELGRFDEAERMFKTCLRRDRENKLGRYNLGLLQLLQGDFLHGWEGFELRAEVSGYEKKSFPNMAAWQGENIRGRTILLYAEQGLGDTIQFARYASVLAQRGARVIIQCEHALARLLETIEGVDEVVAALDSGHGADYYASLLSLPMLCKTTPTEIPGPSPYISASGAMPAAANIRARRVAGKRRVGLVWAGNPDHKQDRKRSLHLGQLIAVLGRDDLEVYSLQIGAAAAQIAELTDAVRPISVFDDVRPLDDVASALKNLDLLISVDTSLAHLAGALAVPVWTLVSYFPDWRWMLDRSDTPWYPSMRLFRQPKPNDWAGAIGEVMAALNAPGVR